jgi:hypothetical protein
VPSDGIAEDLDFELQALKSLIQEETYEQESLSIQASRTAQDLALSLLPLLVNDEDGKKTILPADNGIPGSWNKMQTEIRPLFQKSLFLSAQLKLSMLDKHIFFWPAPGTIFNKDTMREDADDETSVMERRIRLALFPGLRIYPNNEITGTKDDENTMKYTGCRSPGGDVVVKALVLLQ